MITAGSQKARLRSRRRITRPKTGAQSFAAPDHDFSTDDDAFVLGAEAETFVFNRAPTPEPSAAERILATEEEDSDPPPFDAPEMDDEIFQAPHLAKPQQIEASTDAPLLLTTPSPNSAPRTAPRADLDTTPPAPAINVMLAWDRPEVAEALFAPLLKDPALRRARIDIDHGGIDAAIAWAAKAEPDLFVIDSALSGDAMLARLDLLASAVKRGAKIIVLGAVNDITLLRDLAARGVSEYIVPPIAADDLVRSICRLYAEVDTSRVIAVIGARGGVGASTIAHNLAWSIAERQAAGAAIVDLDLSFGTAAFAFRQQPGFSVAEVLATGAHDEDVLDKVAVQPTPRLQIFSAPVSLEREFNFEDAALQNLIARVRRTSPYVVLDLPHVWNGWIKDTLLKADDVLIVAGPDLASLASTKNMLEALKAARPDITPIVVMSMVGVPKRPEIAFKDFATALGVTPALSFGFDPALMGQAAIEGCMIGETAPRSKMAQGLDELAAALTGRDPVATPHVSAPQIQAPPPEAAGVQGTLQRLKRAKRRTLRNEDYLARAREAARQSIKGAPRRRERTSPALRAATALVAMTTLCAWNIDYLRPEAEAAEPVQTQAAAPAFDHAAAFTAAVASFSADPARGLAQVRALAQAGFAPAQYHLAHLYAQGDGVAANADEARRWTERAALGGEVSAMHDLGVYYARGEGADANPVTAFRWFRQAAAHGLADSQFNLGVLYEQGRGVDADPAEALFWFTLAAAQGDAPAAERAAALEARLTPLHVEQARARAGAAARP